MVLLTQGEVWGRDSHASLAVFCILTVRSLAAELCEHDRALGNTAFQHLGCFSTVL